MISIVFALLLQATPPAEAPATPGMEPTQKEATAESAAPAAPAEINAAPSGEAVAPAGVTCRRQPVLGSRVRTQMVCTGAAQTRGDQDALRHIQNHGGSTQAWRDEADGQ